MKRNLLLTTLFIFITSLVFSQVYVEDVNINELDIKYCQLIGYRKNFLGKKIIINVDYGQEFTFLKLQLIKDKDGNTIIFNSIIDALNFMEKNGWEYLNNYAVPYGNSYIYYYLLQKEEE